MPPSVSILLLMRDEIENIRKSWPLLAAQDFTGEVEYVYVDSGSTDGTLEFMAEQGVEAHCIPPETFHHGRTRNLAAGLAKNEVLVYLSGDAIPCDTHWLRKMVEPFEDPKMGGAYGKQAATPGTSPLRAYAMAYEYHDRPEIRDLSQLEGKPSLGMFRMSNANAAVRRDVWERFKYDETVIMSEDVGMCFNILTHGMKVAYVPEAAVWHVHDRDMWYEFQKAFDSALSIKRMGVLGNPRVGGEFHYGLARVRREWRHWWGQGRYGLAVKSLLTSVAKWVAVQLGKRADCLPRWVTRRVSAGVEKMEQARS